MLLDNNAYSTYTPVELEQRVFIGKSVINLILLVSLISSMGFWYALGLEASTSTGFLAVISFSIIGLGLASEVVKKVTLSLFRHKAIWLSATAVSVLTVAGMLAILDNNRELSLLHNSDEYKTAKFQKNEAFNKASQWAWASGFNLETLNRDLVLLIAIRERREISYQTYLAEKRTIQEKIRATQNYQSALNTQTLASKRMVNNSQSATSVSNPLFANIATQTGATYSVLKMFFYLLVTLFLEYAAWFLGGEIEKINDYLRLNARQRLDKQNRQFYGVSLEETAPIKNNQTALPSSLENTYVVLINGTKKGEKKGVSAQKILDLVLNYLERKELLDVYTEAKIKVINTRNKADFASHKINSPTLENAPVKIAPDAPKEVQNTARTAPKEAQAKNAPKPITTGQGAGAVTRTSTPDTGTTGDTAHRYNAIKDAVKDGKIKATLRAIRGYKIDGVGCGDKISKEFKTQLIKDGVIKA